jgi:hypothetical protein
MAACDRCWSLMRPSSSKWCAMAARASPICDALLCHAGGQQSWAFLRRLSGTGSASHVCTSLRFICLRLQGSVSVADPPGTLTVQGGTERFIKGQQALGSNSVHFSPAAGLYWGHAHPGRPSCTPMLCLYYCPHRAKKWYSPLKQMLRVQQVSSRNHSARRGMLQTMDRLVSSLCCGHQDIPSWAPHAVSAEILPGGSTGASAQHRASPGAPCRMNGLGDALWNETGLAILPDAAIAPACHPSSAGSLQ